MGSISINASKYIRHLHQKKFRQSERTFLVEGFKSIEVLLSSNLRIEHLYITENSYQNLSAKSSLKKIDFTITDEKSIESLSTLQANNAGIAIVKEPDLPPAEITNNKQYLILDDIRDPGNLGTIIRIAHWYGFTEIFCSPSTVEWFSPKTIAATMGSFTAVKGYYLNILPLIKDLREQGITVYGALMKGKSIYETRFSRGCAIVIGNESNGISREVINALSQGITIPAHIAKEEGGAESLNAAIATAIFLDNLKRPQ